MINFDIIEQNIRKHNEDKVNLNCFLGSICGIWDGKGKLLEVSSGYRNLEKTEKVSRNSIFRIASMTKPILGTAFMQQFEKGRLQLDEPISKWIPEFQKMRVATKVENRQILSLEDAIREITPRMLLTHSAGVGCGASYGAQYRPMKKELSLEKSVKKYAECALDFQPGTQNSYSPVWGFDIIAHLIELVCDMPYEDYIKKYIFKPLGMQDTTYMPTDEQLLRCVDLVTQTDEGLAKHKLPAKIGFFDFEEGFASGGAGLFSTLSDYGNFVRMMLNGGELDGERILSEESVKTMSTPQLPAEMEGITEYLNWGLGTMVLTKQEKDVQPLPRGTFKFSGFFGTHSWIDKENDIACIYMMNISNGGDISDLPGKEFEKDVMSGII